MGLPEIDYKSKGKGPEAIQMAIKQSGFKSNQSIFVEDSKRNLRIAKDAEPDLTTIWVVHAEPKQFEKPDFVDAIAYNQRDIMQELCKAHI